MKNILAVKIILSSIPKVEATRKSLLVENNNLARSSLGRVNTYEIAQKILDNIDSSDELHNLKVITMEWLETLSPRSRYIVKLYYFKDFTVEQISDVLGVSMSTLFRLLDKLTENFAEYLMTYRY